MNKTKLKTVENNVVIGAGGTKYYPHSTISINRYRKLEELNIHFSYDKTPIGLFNELLEIHKCINEGRIADIAIITKDMMDALAGIMNRTDIGLKISALFLNADDEDLSDASDELIDRKIKDWTDAGYDAISFFGYATSLQNDLIKLSENVSQDISDTKKTLEKVKKIKESQ